VTPTGFPLYLAKPDLSGAVVRLNTRLSPCVVCPRRCGADRSRAALSGAPKGACRMGYLPMIASWNLHHGEEPPISGTRGSGTIFFSGCPLRCVFCQNFPISQLLNGNEVTVETLAGYMLELQTRGAHNINFVTPTHFVPQMIEALSIAAGKGLGIPVVYNSSGYEDLETLRLLEGVVDIYLPDMKYSDDENAVKYTSAPGYVEINRAAIREMYRQVGDLVLDDQGIARCGLIIRHLVLPGGFAGTRKTLEFIAGLSPAITVSIMSQYFPAHRAHVIPEISGKLGVEEYEEITEMLEEYGLENGWIQPLEGE
jgi:putative pyruvate formate lyase activating enzyme